jgi:crotonobetainyl-CoA:carnitine CoA-transferase CaiB-like acyl-CoA transferase
MSLDPNDHMTLKNGTKPLGGVKVIEWAQMVAGPYCAKVLADLGADVIKIEPPNGDEARQRGPYLKDERHPEKSLLFLYLNTNKKGITLDLHAHDDRNKFIQLIQWADILIEDHLPQTLIDLKLTYDELAKINSSLVMTSITPFGQTGPYRNYKAYPLNVWHGGGMGYISPMTPGVAVPLKPGAYFSECSCGITAATGTLSALFYQRTTGSGQQVDISKQEAIMNLARVQLDRYPNEGAIQRRGGFSSSGPSLAKCKDGYTVHTCIQPHETQALIKFVAAHDKDKFEKFLDEQYRSTHWQDANRLIYGFFKDKPKDWLYHNGQAFGVPITPIMTSEDIAKSEQSAARQFFIEGNHSVTGKLTYPNSPYRFSKFKMKIESTAPLLGEHNAQVFVNPVRHEKNAANKPRKYLKRALEGIRIADFSWAWAGPHATELLASMGAQVIKIESMSRFDFVRQLSFTTGQKFSDVNSSTVFNDINLGKLGVQLNLAKHEGIELAKKIVKISDVVIQNMRPGVMDKLGLSYEQVCKVKPDIVYLSSSTRGSQGPEKNYSGYATNFAAVGGITHLCGMPGSDPGAMAGEIDLISAITAACAILAGLNHRDATGEGQHIDLSSTESIHVLLGDVLMDYFANGRVQNRQGNLDEIMAPHNCYRCKGDDKWISIAVGSDEEWRSLIKAMGNQEWAQEERFRSIQSRWQNQPELDKLLEAWTLEFTHYEIMEKLQAVGVAAVPVFNAEEIYNNPHVKSRGCWTQVTHEVLDKQIVLMPGWRLSKTPFNVESAAPLIGQHNEYVFCELLGMSKEALKRLRENRVIY